MSRTDEVWMRTITDALFTPPNPNRMHHRPHPDEMSLAFHKVSIPTEQVNGPSFVIKFSS